MESYNLNATLQTNSIPTGDTGRMKLLTCDCCRVGILCHEDLRGSLLAPGAALGVLQEALQAVQTCGRR